MQARIDEMGLTVAAFARRAGIGEATARRTLSGRSWPRPGTRDKINAALGWPPGEVAHRSIDPRPLDVYTTEEIVEELCKRLVGGRHRSLPRRMRSLRERHADTGSTPRS